MNMTNYYLKITPLIEWWNQWIYLKKFVTTNFLTTYRFYCFSINVTYSKKKIKIKNIGSVNEFSDYSGAPNSYADGLKYFKNKFTALNKNPTKSIFIHETCATDTDQVRFVFESCKKIILSESLAMSGFAS